MNIINSAYSIQMKAGIFKQLLGDRNLQKHFIQTAR